MQVCFTNLGCKLNQAELERLARVFSHAGHQITRDLASADLHVVNTCTVTHVAERDSRKIARRGRRLNPRIRTVLTGCYVAQDPERSKKETGVDLIVANQDKERLLETVQEAFPQLAAREPTAPENRDLPYGQLDFGNARALVKIEDGCNMHCSFCIIPATRGRQRSRPPGEVVREVDDLVAAGFPEIVLTGVQISSYRYRGLGLFDLASRILNETMVRRLRLTSIAPWQFDSRLLELFETNRLCRHVHLSLQSGSSKTLERMRRPYTADDFAALVGRLRARVSGLAITTDVIAGFPGETDTEFEESLAFVRAMGFTRVHAFPYSVRPGTAAAELGGQIEFAAKKDRVLRLRQVGDRSERDFVESQIGLEAEILWEAERDGTWHGTSDNYLRARTRSGSNLARRLTRSVLGERRGNLAYTQVEAALASPPPALETIRNFPRTKRVVHGA